jgi:hypothetical protein
MISNHNKRNNTILKDKENVNLKSNISELSPTQKENIRKKVAEQQSRAPRNRIPSQHSISNTEKNEHKLLSVRDPKRRPLQNRSPFAPFSRGTPLAPTVTVSSGKLIPNDENMKNALYPGYASVNKNGLLQISKHPPRVVDITVGSAEKASGALPIFPITFNGGSMGIYLDPNEFGKGGVNAMSQNGHDQMRVPRSYISFPHNFGQGTYSDEKRKAESRSIRFHNTRDRVDKDDDSSHDLESNLKRILRYKTSKNEKGERVVSVWDTWHRIFNFVATFREKHAETDIIRTLPPNKIKQRARLSSVYNEDDYDFAIVLQTREVYAFWAELLDFREENGYRVKTHSDYLLSGTEKTEVNPPTNRKKRRSDMIELDDTSFISCDNSCLWDQDIDTNKGFSIGAVTPTRNFYRSKTVNDYGQFLFSKGKSLFDRAIEGDLSPTKTSSNEAKSMSPIRTVARKIRKSLSSRFSLSSNRNNSERKATPSSARRRWGNKYHGDDSPFRAIMSPPVHSLPKSSPKKASRPRMTYSRDHNTDSARKRIKQNENVLEMDEIPNQTVPRGIKARETGLKDFLWAMRNGIVVRKIRPNHDPVYVRLSSLDGGDTIHYQYLYPEDAVIALRQQRQKYNKQNLHGYGDEEQNDHGAWVPLEFDQVKHDDISSREGRGSIGVRKSVEELVIKKLASGSFKASELVAVQRATHPDPLTRNNYYDEETQKQEVEFLGDGTPTLRAYQDRISKAQEGDLDYLKVDNVRTFSLILPNNLAFARGKASLAQLNDRWLQNKASEKDFRFLDFEAATNGEYWILFSGFLWLHRDAMNGRFDAQRNKGFGAGAATKKIEVEQAEKYVNNSVSVIQEPIEKGCFARMISKFSNAPEDTSANANIKPPPSDYFLGYTSEGTMIWGRLRNAGLDTERIYALDTKTVMIKIKCPEDRLMDVAEVLRLKMKTTHGYFAPFKESEKEIFKPSDVSIGSGNSVSAYNLFSSAVTQHIIDFIINSRIRDSGAGLSGQTALDKSIAIRTPLHKHAKLEALCDLWVFFWREKNWLNCTRMKSLLMLDEKWDDNSENDIQSGKTALKPFMSRVFKGCVLSTFDREEGEYPVLFVRFIVGTFFQPLDSIEEYFGEKVTFYFAWLQHSSFHLIPISILGLIVFLCQVLSGKFDHEVRPYYACIVMIWSFYVMCSWRKRQNFLIHRWGSLNHNQDESPRPQFYGDEKVDEVTGEKVMHYPSWKRWIKYMLSFPLTVAFTFSALIGLLMMHANRDLWLARYFANSDEERFFDINWSLSAIGNKDALGAVELSKAHFQDPKFWYIVSLPPLILGLTLPLLNFILMQISRGLNDFENHKTESQYRNALIAKVIAFRFVAYFAALYYYAYIATGPDETTVENGILRVATSLVIYLTVANWWGIFLGIYLPLLILKWRKYRDRLKLRSELRTLQVLEQTYTKDKNLTSEEAMRIEKSIINKRILIEQAQSEVWQEMM